jgi:hypothetical protein
MPLTRCLMRQACLALEAGVQKDGRPVRKHFVTAIKVEKERVLDTLYLYKQRQCLGIRPNR